MKLTPAYQITPAYMAIAAVTLAACSATMSVNSPAGPEQHDTQSVPLDKSERVRAQLKMNSGELDVRGGGSMLMNADFTYNVAEWKPNVRYTSTSGVGDLVVEQPGSSTSSGKAKNHWELRFNDTVPLDLKAEFGAGEAQLNLGSLSLRGLEIAMGAGKLRLDLRGTPTRDYSVHIQGGVGEATVYLPKDVGISASVSGGLGEVSATGLSKNGDRYENALQNAKVHIRLQIEGGVGSIKLIAE